MKRAVSQFGIHGFRVRIHHSCAVALVLISAMVVTQLPESYSFWQRAVLGVATGLLFMLLLVAREFVSAFGSGRDRVLRVAVTLFPFGGVSSAADELLLPRQEILVAAVGFLSSLGVVVLTYGIYALAMASEFLTVAWVFEWLTFFWSGLFLLHFIPGYPLDGGRILRAILLKRYGDYFRSTYVSSVVGWTTGLLLIFCGITLFIVTRQLFLGVPVIVMGWLLWSASGKIRNEVTILMALESVSVQDVMKNEYRVLDGNLSIGELYRHYILVSGWDHYIVANDRALPSGILSEKDVKGLPLRRWGSVPVRNVAVRLSEADMVYPSQSGAEALQTMERLGVDFIPVIKGNSIIGVVSRERLMRLGRTRAEFGV